MKTLVKLLEKIKQGGNLDPQQKMLSEMPLYKILGFKDANMSAKAIKKQCNQ
jgi:hypothetical protein